MQTLSSCPLDGNKVIEMECSSPDSKCARATVSEWKWRGYFCLESVHRQTV